MDDQLGAVLVAGLDRILVARGKEAVRP